MRPWYSCTPTWGKPRTPRRCWAGKPWGQKLVIYSSSWGGAHHLREDIERPGVWEAFSWSIERVYLRNKNSDAVNNHNENKNILPKRNFSFANFAWVAEFYVAVGTWSSRSMKHSYRIGAKYLVYARKRCKTNKNMLSEMMIDRFFKFQRKFFEHILRAKHYLDIKIRLTDNSQQQHKQCRINSQNISSWNNSTTIWLSLSTGDSDMTCTKTMHPLPHPAGRGRKQGFIFF